MYLRHADWADDADFFSNDLNPNYTRNLITA